MTHVCRTTDPAKADVFFIPVFSANALRNNKLPCADAQPGNQHNCSRSALFRRLDRIRTDASDPSSQSYLQRRSGADHFILSGTQGCSFSTTPAFELKHFDPRLMSTMHFAVEQLIRGNFSWPTPYTPIKKYYSFPWSGAIHFPSSTPWSELSWRSEHQRDILVGAAFSNSLRSGSTQKLLREALLRSCHQEPAHVCTILSNLQIRLGADTLRSIARLYYNATFCLQPLGDGPTRAGIIDSLLLGCIPVLFHPAQLQWPLHSHGWLHNATLMLDLASVIGPSRGLGVIEELKSVPREQIARMQRVIAERAHCVHYLAESDGRAGGGATSTLQGTLGEEKDAFDIVLEAVWHRARHGSGQAASQKSTEYCRPVLVQTRVASGDQLPIAATITAEQQAVFAESMATSSEICPLDTQLSTRAEDSLAVRSPRGVSSFDANWPHEWCFDNKADLHALLDLMRTFSSEICAASCFTAVVGGLNLGDAARLIFKWCPRARLHAFEIQHRLYRSAAAWFRQYPNAQLHNLGMGNVDFANYTVSIPGNAREGAGIYTSWRGIAHPLTKATTVRLFEFAQREGLAQVHYALIDVEGFEPNVMEGMALHTVTGQHRFPAFQWEATEAWDDSRHPKGAMDRNQQLEALRGWGYKSYAIGTSSQCGIGRAGAATLLDWSCNASAIYLPISPSFVFKLARARFEGNILSLHRRFASPLLWKWVLSRTAQLP